MTQFLLGLIAAGIIGGIVGFSAAVGMFLMISYWTGKGTR